MKILFIIVLFLAKTTNLYAQKDTVKYWIEDEAPPIFIPKKVKKIIAWYSVYTPLNDTITNKVFEWKFENQKLVETTDYTKKQTYESPREKQMKNKPKKITYTHSYDTLLDKKGKPLKYFHTQNRIDAKGKLLTLWKDTTHITYNTLNQIIREHKIEWLKYWKKEKESYEFSKSIYTTHYKYDDFGNLIEKHYNNHQYEDIESLWRYSYDEKNRLIRYYENLDPQYKYGKVIYEQNKIIVTQTSQDGEFPSVKDFHYEFISNNKLIVRKRKYHPSSNRLYAWIDYQYTY